MALPNNPDDYSFPNMSVHPSGKNYHEADINLKKCYESGVLMDEMQVNTHDYEKKL